MESDMSRRRFRWAMILAWTPWIPLLFGLANLFVGINNSMATGLGAVVGAMAEAFIIWGIASLVIVQVVAIVLLSGCFSKKDLLRSVISFVSICVSAMSLLLVGGFFWLERFIAHR